MALDPALAVLYRQAEVGCQGCNLLCQAGLAPLSLAGRGLSCSLLTLRLCNVPLHMEHSSSVPPVYAAGWEAGQCCGLKADCWQRRALDTSGGLYGSLHGRKPERNDNDIWDRHAGSSLSLQAHQTSQSMMGPANLYLAGLTAHMLSHAEVDKRTR